MDRKKIIFLFLGGILCSQLSSVNGDCTRPSINSDEVEIDPDKTSYGLYDVISITCIGNATLTGISPNIFCDTDNDWNRDVSFIDCLADCSLSSLDDNLRATCQNKVIEGVLVTHGTTVDFECEGIVSGNPSSTCSDGSWSSPFPVCIQDTVPTTTPKVASTLSTKMTPSADMMSSSSHVTIQNTTHITTPTDSGNTSVSEAKTTILTVTSPTLVSDDGNVTVPDLLTTQVADATNLGNATTSHLTTNSLGKTDFRTTVAGETNQTETIEGTEFKKTVDPGTATTMNTVNHTDVKTTSPGLADVTATMSGGMTTAMKTSDTQKTVQSDLTTSKNQFTETGFSTESSNNASTEADIRETEPGFTTNVNEQRTIDVDVTTKLTVSTTQLVDVTDSDGTTGKGTTTFGNVTEYDQETIPTISTTTLIVGATEYYSTTQHNEKSTIASNTSEVDTSTTKFLRTTMQTDVLTDGEFSTPKTPQIIEITNGMTTELELTTASTTSLGYMTTQEDTKNQTEMKSTSVLDTTTPANYSSTMDLGVKSTTEGYKTIGKDLTTTQSQTAVQTELTTARLPSTKMTTDVESTVTSKFGITSQQAIGITDATAITTLKLTTTSTTSDKNMPTKNDIFKTSYSIQSTETMVQTEFLTDETLLTKMTTDAHREMTSMQETTSSTVSTTNDGSTTKLEPATSQSVTSPGIRDMTTIKDTFTSPVTTPATTSGGVVTSPKVTYITTLLNDTTDNQGIASTLGDERTTYLTTQVARVTTPSPVESTDPSNSTEQGTSQTSAANITTKVDLKTETSVPTTTEEDLIRTTEGVNLRTVATDKPTIETEIISEEVSTSNPVFRATTEAFEELTTILNTTKNVTSISEKITNSTKVMTTSEKVTSSSVPVTDSDTPVTTGVSKKTTVSTAETDEPKDSSTAREKTSIPTTNEMSSISSVNISTTGKFRTTSKTTTTPSTCEDISCVLPSAVKCGSAGRFPVCVCREGYFRRRNEQTCTEAESFQNSIRVISQTNGRAVTYDRQLEDPTSQRFLSLAEDICTAIDAIFENDSMVMQFYLGCKVFRFRQGSVIADFVTYLTISLNTTEELDTSLIIQQSLGTDNALPSSNFIVDPVSITSQPTNECDLGIDDCDYWNADCTDKGASGFSCQCKEGYRDDSPESLPGRTCTEASVNVSLLVSILLILFLVILVLVVVCILLSRRRLKVTKGHPTNQTPVQVDSEIALYAMGEVIPEP